MSVIGSGMMATRFKADFAYDKNILVFASGVSNSKEQNTGAFMREEKLLRESIKEHEENKIIYFSTCSIYDPSESGSLYIKHKLKMEEIVFVHARNYMILRAPNLVGHLGNTHTIINFLVNKITASQRFECWKNSERNILDIDDFYKAATRVINESKNMIVNIFNYKYYAVPDIIRIIESFFGIKALYTEVEKGSSYRIKCGIKICSSADDYLDMILSKYYD